MLFRITELVIVKARIMHKIIKSDAVNVVIYLIKFKL